MNEEGLIVNIPAAANELQDLQRQVGEVKDKLKASQLAYAKEKWGVEIGSVVAGTRGDTKDKLFVVTDISSFSASVKPWLMGFPHKKDGGLAKAARHIYDEWELYQPGNS